MSSSQRLLHWLNTHRDRVLDLIRIYLGMGLFVRGMLFISASEGVEVLVDLSDFSLSAAVIAHYVSFVHLLGGLMLAAGLLTRLVTLLQIPILFGAVFFVHWQEGLLSGTQSLEFSALVLFLLVVLLVFGSGRWSADQYVFVREPEIHDEEELETWWRTEEEQGAPVGAEATTATASQADVAGTAKRAVQSQADVDVCQCGHDLNHPRVTVEPQYGWSAGFYFMLGISAPVKEIVFYCEKCGTVLKRSRDPQLRRKYQWHNS